MPGVLPEAIKVLHFAREEAQLFQATCLGSEHLFLGILRESQEREFPHYLRTEHLLLGMLRLNEERKETLFTRLGLRSPKETSEENLFASTGLRVEDVRRWTLLVLAGGATDDRE